MRRCSSCARCRPRRRRCRFSPRTTGGRSTRRTPQSIAFTRVNGQGRVFTLEVVAAGGGSRVVRLAQASSQLLPSWSPDSSRIAYQSAGRIYTVARDGSGRRFVTTGLYPDWSPDGTSIAYVRAGALRVGAKVLATQVIRKPDWSPGRRRRSPSRARTAIHVVTRAGAERHGRATTESASRRAPVWSFDGTKLAYSVAGGVYVVAADGASNAAPGSSPARSGLARPARVGADGRRCSPTRPTGSWCGRPGSTPTVRTHGVRAVAAEVGASFAPGDPARLPDRILGARGQDLSGPQLASACAMSRLLSGTCTIAGTRGGRRDRRHPRPLAT